jgi:hypothetical protein
MKYNAKCSKRPGVALVIAMSWLSACATGSSESAPGVCPPVVKYNRAEQVKAANEIETLPDQAILADWLADYSVLREQARTCGA